MCDFSVLLLVAVYQARIVECSVGETSHIQAIPFESRFVAGKPFLRGRRLSAAETLRLLIAFT